MPDYRPKTRFNHFNKGGPRGGSDRFGARDSHGDRQLYKAECSNCHMECEVPFRPNGVKPVYCRNCFKRDDDAGARSDFRGDSRSSYDSREQRAPFSPRSTRPEGQSNDDVKRQLIALNSKLDKLVQLMETAARAAAAPTSTPAKHQPNAESVNVKEVSEKTKKAKAKKAAKAPK